MIRVCAVPISWTGAYTAVCDSIGQSGPVEFFVDTNGNFSYTSGNGFNYPSGVPNLPVGRYFELVWTAKNSGSYEYAQYVNGVLVSSGSPWSGTVPNPTMTFGRNSGGGGTDGDLVFLQYQVSLRYFSQLEVQSLYKNPWQLFAPPLRRIWVPVAAGGDITVTLAGSAVTASAGTLGVAATVAAVGSAVVASAGTVTASRSLLLAGEVMSALVGVLTGGLSVAVAGSAVTTSTGAMTPGMAVTLTGAQVSVLPGTMTASGGTASAVRQVLPTWYYVPGPMTGVPTDIKREFERVSQSTYAAAPSLRLQVLNVPPEKPRTGEVACADGALWNPGLGFGWYGFNGSTWIKLG